MADMFLRAALRLSCVCSSWNSVHYHSLIVRFQYLFLQEQRKTEKMTICSLIVEEDPERACEGFIFIFIDSLRSIK